MASLTNLVGLTDNLSGDRAKLYLVPLNDDDSIRTEDIIKLQFFPESISDSKGVTYNSETPFGASHPIYSFISGDERSISFSTYLSRDMYDTDVKNEYNIDIETIIKKLRSYLYPDYQSDGRLLVAPHRFKLAIVSKDRKKYINGIFIMTSCEIEIIKFFHNGDIRLASVDLEFVETVQNKFGINYVSRSSNKTGFYE